MTRARQPASQPYRGAMQPRKNNLRTASAYVQPGSQFVDSSVLCHQAAGPAFDGIMLVGKRVRVTLNSGRPRLRKQDNGFGKPSVTPYSGCGEVSGNESPCILVRRFSLGSWVPLPPP